MSNNRPKIVDSIDPSWHDFCLLWKDFSYAQKASWIYIDREAVTRFSEWLRTGDDPQYEAVPIGTFISDEVLEHEYEHITYAKGSIFLSGEYSLDQLKAIVDSMDDWNNRGKNSLTSNNAIGNYYG